MQSRCEELVSKAKRIIAAHPNYTVAEIAKECAVSESALYAAFCKHSDKSMNETKKMVVMEAARQQLVSTDLSVEEISRSMNFSSSTYFRKCFKDYFGISPSQMRKSYKI